MADTRSTYRNDGMTSTYPFVPGADIPFSYGCISELRICLHASQAPIGHARVVSVTVHDGKVSAVVSLSVGGVASDFVLEAGRDESVVKGLEGDNFTGAALMIVGEPLETDDGSYTTDLQLEDSCLTVMPDAVYTRTPGIRVNGTEMPLDKRLSIVFAGLFGVVGVPQDVDASGYSIGVKADAARYEELTTNSTVYEYDKVNSINNTPLDSTPDSVYTGTLFLCIKCPDIEAAAAAAGEDSHILDYDKAADWMTATVSGDVGTVEQLPTEGYDPETPEGTVIVTLVGSKNIPNCYDRDADDAPGSGSDAAAQPRQGMGYYDVLRGSRR